jgi:hypothetical protein
MSVVSKLVSDWKEIIESIDTSGYTRQVESVDIIKMPGDRFCYKVNYNFGLSSGNEDESFVQSRMIWSTKLEEEFSRIFEAEKTDYGLYRGFDSVGVIRDDKIDYFHNQGHRIIIQFYPLGFLSQIRSEKLEELGI